MTANKHEEELRAFRLPPGVEADVIAAQRLETAEGAYRLLKPVLNGAKVREICDRLVHNRNTYMAGLRTSDVVERIDAAVQKWMDPDYPLRKLAERLLPAVTGYDAEMIRLQLKRYMRTFRKKELLRFLDEELGDSRKLDEFRPGLSGGFSRAYGPELLFHVFSGNVPGVPIWSLVMGLLVKSAQLGKTSSAEPLMAVWFAESLAEVDERLAAAMAVVPWKGGDAELEEAAIEAAGTVVAYGGDAAVASLRARTPVHKRFVAYGHKISIALIGREALTPDRMRDTTMKLAEDVALYDQQSCMSPQSVWVEEGGAVTPRQFAESLAAELERLELRRPRAVLSEEEALAIRKVRTGGRIEEMNETGAAVYESADSTAWTVIYRDSPGLQPSPLNRTVHVFGCGRLEEGLPHLAPYRAYLQSCGVAVGPVRLFELAAALGEAGVNRLCPIGAMNQAKAGWHHDGRFNVLDLVRYVDVERGTEDAAEGYDPDVE